MKAYTVYQPYADAIITGLKTYETRSRKTNIRGRVAVHAGKKTFEQATKSLSDGDFWGLAEIAERFKLTRPRGVIVGTVEIVDCVPIEEIIDTLTEQERLLGDYSPGRYAWILKNPIKFDIPIPAKGHQGWWEWEVTE